MNTEVNTYYYRVAETLFGVEVDPQAWKLVEGPYLPFEVPAEQIQQQSLCFLLKAFQHTQPCDAAEWTLLGHFGSEGTLLDVYRNEQGHYRFHMGIEGCDEGAQLFYEPDNDVAQLFINDDVPMPVMHYALNNAMMLLYALYTASLGVMLFHASVIMKDGCGYMFLGKSGTGKSTHTSLWLKYIKGTELLNDDNPAVKVNAEGVAIIYGTPWSGKTPCYKNKQVPLGAAVRLHQAPYNKIEPLSSIFAYAVLAPSVSCMKWDKAQADSLHQNLQALMKAIKVYSLECLPDEAAAQLSCQTLTLH